MWVWLARTGHPRAQGPKAGPGRIVAVPAVSVRPCSTTERATTKPGHAVVGRVRATHSVPDFGDGRVGHGEADVQPAVAGRARASLLGARVRGWQGGPRRGGRVGRVRATLHGARTRGRQCGPRRGGRISGALPSARSVRPSSLAVWGATTKPTRSACRRKRCRTSRRKCCRSVVHVPHHYGGISKIMIRMLLLPGRVVGYELDRVEPTRLR